MLVENGRQIAIRIEQPGLVPAITEERARQSGIELRIRPKPIDQLALRFADAFEMRPGTAFFETADPPVSCIYSQMKYSEAAAFAALASPDLNLFIPYDFRTDVRDFTPSTITGDSLYRQQSKSRLKLELLSYMAQSLVLLGQQNDPVDMYLSSGTRRFEVQQIYTTAKTACGILESQRDTTMPKRSVASLMEAGSNPVQQVVTYVSQNGPFLLVFGLLGFALTSCRAQISGFNFPHFFVNDTTPSALVVPTKSSPTIVYTKEAPTQAPSPTPVNEIYPGASPSPLAESSFPSYVGKIAVADIKKQEQDFSTKINYSGSSYENVVTLVKANLAQLKIAYEATNKDKLEFVTRFDESNSWWTIYLQNQHGQMLAVLKDGKPMRDFGAVVELWKAASDLKGFSLQPVGFATFPSTIDTDPPVPQFGTQDIVPVGKLGVLVQRDVTGTIIAHWNPETQLWIDESTGQSLLPLSGLEISKGGAFGKWEAPVILSAPGGKPDFVTNPDHWPKVPAGKATAGNFKDWIKYFEDLSSTVFIDPTGDVNNNHFGWGPSPDAPMRTMGSSPPDNTDNRPLANELEFGVTFQDAIQDVITGKKEDVHLIAYRIRLDNGKNGLVPVLMSDWEYKIMVVAKKNLKFSRKGNIVIDAPTLALVNSQDLSLLPGAYKQEVLFLRALRQAGWLTDADFDRMRSWIEDNFSTYNYHPNILPPGLRFVVGGVGIF